MSLTHLDPIQGLVHDEIGDPTAPAVIYLPGVHGDPHLMRRAREWMAERVRLIEITYPRVEAWKLRNYAGALEDLMDVLELDSAHLIGESFGSLVGWEFGLTHPTRVKSHILVGGFSRPPMQHRAALAGRALRSLPGPLLEKGVAWMRSTREGREALDEELGWTALPQVVGQSARARRAAASRLDLLRHSDFAWDLRRVPFAVRYLGGGEDTAVGVWQEARLLRNRLHPDCGFASRIIVDAPHGVLASHPRQSAEQIADWVERIEQESEAD